MTKRCFVLLGDLLHFGLWCLVVWCFYLLLHLEVLMVFVVCFCVFGKVANVLNMFVFHFFWGRGGILVYWSLES